MGIVAIHYDALGDPDGVTLRTAEGRLLVDLLDGRRGALLSWDEAQSAELPSVKSALMVLANIEAVNGKLVEAGGEPLEGSYFTNRIQDSDVQVFGYGIGGTPFTYVMPTKGTLINTKFKIRLIKEI